MNFNVSAIDFKWKCCLILTEVMHDSLKCETFCVKGDLENMVKVKLIKCNEMSSDNASWVQVSSLHMKWLLICGHLSIPLVIMAHEIQKWGHCDLILGMLCSTHLRCLQFWYGTPRPSSLKTIYLIGWNPIGFYWKSLLLLWPCQMRNWSGWCMLGSLQTQGRQFVPLSKFQMWKPIMIMVTLKIRSRSNFSHAIKGLVIMHLRYEYKFSTTTGYWSVDICLSHWL